MAKVAYKRRQERASGQPHRIKIRKDDMVKVISGRDKGKTGKVLEVDRLSRKVTVEGVDDCEAPHAAEPVTPDQGWNRG